MDDMKNDVKTVTMQAEITETLHVEDEETTEVLDVDTKETTETLHAENKETTEPIVSPVMETKLVELTSWEQDLQKREAALQEAREELEVRQVRQQVRLKALMQREQTVASAEQTQAAREERLRGQEEAAQKLQQEQAAIKEEKEKIDRERMVLREREHELTVKAAEQNTQFLTQQQGEFNKLLAQMNEQCRSAGGKAMQQLTDEMTKERSRRLNELMVELEARRDTVEKDIAAKRAELQQEMDMLMDVKKRQQEQEQELATRQEKMENAQRGIDFENHRLQAMKEQLTDQLAQADKNIERRVQEDVVSVEARLTALQQTNDDLCRQLTESENARQSLDSFTAVYGNHPDIIQKQIKDLQNAVEAFKAELDTRPGKEVQRECVTLKERCANLDSKLENARNEVVQLCASQMDAQKIKNQNTILKASNDSLNAQFDEAQKVITSLSEQLKRLTATEDAPADREARIKSMYGHVQELDGVQALPVLDKAQIEARVAEIGSESAWLTKISKNCQDYGFVFPQRLLYAFHTALKISDWSTITVLAGVSGTGKSELPRLYSAFGGINFINVPVQPNWDSQESMLGFFNSIDNKFDAQAALRFLVQCTDAFQQQMAIVLLDEMNLAHVEHYFADFLSKLEQRRGIFTEEALPHIDVSIGAGLSPFELPLRRNILWCGTMNQDETTKSLSDKVLDRGIVITFPRPRELKSREGMRDLAAFKSKRNIVPLRADIWQAWRAKRTLPLDSKAGQKMASYKKLLEEINEYLAKIGRAIGHRVWQSTEFYVANYPLVKEEYERSNGDMTATLEEAMHTAMEDQIVQKVMPKLRGIDTKGASYENCLLPIKELLHSEEYAFNLDEDFDLACEMGYGQFMWGSAEYLGRKDKTNPVQEGGV